MCKGRGRERGSSLPCLRCKGKGVIAKPKVSVEERKEKENIEDKYEEAGDGEEKG